MSLILCIIIVRLSVYDELTIEQVCCSTICTSTETYCPFCGGLIYTANQNISCHQWFKLLHKKQVILEEKREAGAQRNKGGEPDKELGEKGWEMGVPKWQEVGEITWQYLIFWGSKRSKGRKPQKRAEAAKAKHGRWEIWTPSSPHPPPTPPPHTHTHTHTLM